MKRIKIENCSAKMITLARPLGFTTLLSFKRFIEKCNPNAKIYFSLEHMRAVDVLKYIQKEIDSINHSALRK